MTDIKATTFESDPRLAAAARSGRMIAEMSTEENPLIGHLTIGIFADGGYSTGYLMPTGPEHFMGPTLFIAFVKEIIARDLTGALASDDYAREYLT